MFIAQRIPSTRKMISQAVNWLICHSVSWLVGQSVILLSVNLSVSVTELLTCHLQDSVCYIYRHNAHN